MREYFLCSKYHAIFLRPRMQQEMAAQTKNTTPKKEKNTHFLLRSRCDVSAAAPPAAPSFPASDKLRG